MNTASSSPQPRETAKQFMLRMTAFTVSVYLLLSEVKSVYYLGLILLVANSVLNVNEQRAAKLIPLWLFTFAAFMAAHLADLIEPVQGVPLILKYHHAFGFTMIGIWTVGISWEYRKWRASRSDKQPE